MTGSHQTDYGADATERCERALITLLGDVGPWSDRIYLVGGLAPRYIVGQVPADVPPHVGTADVDMVIALALGDESPHTYRTLRNNLKSSGFEQSEPSFAWTRSVDGVAVRVEFLCETSEVEPGRIYRPKGEDTGSGLGAFNVAGAGLVRFDHIDIEIEGMRLDGGGRSRVVLKVAGLLPYTVLKILAFQDRHQNKDAYDLIFTLLNYRDGPQSAGLVAAQSPVLGEAKVEEALELLAERFVDIDADGPSAYADFLAAPGSDDDDLVRLKREAVATVAQFLEAIDAAA